MARSKEAEYVEDSYRTYAEVRNDYMPIYRGFTIFFAVYMAVGVVLASLSGVVDPANGTLLIAGITMAASGLAACFQPVLGMLTWCIGTFISIASGVTASLSSTSGFIPEESPFGWMFVIVVIAFPLAALVKLDQQKAERRAMLKVYHVRREERRRDTVIEEN